MSYLDIKLLESRSPIYSSKVSVTHVQYSDLWPHGPTDVYLRSMPMGLGLICWLQSMCAFLDSANTRTTAGCILVIGRSPRLFLERVFERARLVKLFVILV